MLEQSLDRCTGLLRPAVIGALEHRGTLAELTLGYAVDVLLEPVGRNTAPAAVIAAHHTLTHHSDALVLLMPADHRIADLPAFRAAVVAGEAAARRGELVVFGVIPDRAHTAYGWIEAEGAGPCRPVRRFVEKPDAERAQQFLEAGMLCNAGIFLFQPGALLGAMEQFAPEVLAGASRAWHERRADGAVQILDSAALEQTPSVALDVAVMEQTDRASVVPVDMGWSDLGGFDALAALSDGPVGDVEAFDCDNCYLHAEGVLLAASGLRDLVVVATQDAVLVSRRGDDAAVGALVRTLKDRPEVHEHPVMSKPWGRYEVLASGPGHKVKRLTIQPSHQLSLQSHRHRAEHWVVVEGRGRAIRDAAHIELGPGEHLHLPKGSVHSLANTGVHPLVLIEVQLGETLLEQDIERLDDPYGR